MRHLFMAAEPRLDFDLDRTHLTCYAVCSVRFQYKMLNCRSESASGSCEAAGLIKSKILERADGGVDFACFF